MDRKVEAQHLQGRLTARERIALLCDENSFEELVYAIDDQSVVVGHGLVHGRRIFVFAKDHTCLSGSLSPAHAQKIIDVQKRALAAKAPLVGLFDSAGMRLANEAATLQAYAEIIQHHVSAQGLIPQIAMLMGPCIGADAFAASLMDLRFMVTDTSGLAVTGPEIANQFSDITLSLESLGGARLHAEQSGLADAVFDDDIMALAQLRRFIDFLPAPGRVWKTFDTEVRTEPSLASLVPQDPSSAYDVKELIAKVVDDGDFLELRESFAGNLLTGLARMDGHTVGILANQPMLLGGVLDVDALAKAERFVSFCSAIQIPILTFVDAPGFLPGAEQEMASIAAAGAKLMTAFAKRRNPMITLVLGQAFGAAFTMMGSKQLSGSITFAWPSARIGMMNAEGAILTVHEAEAQGLIDRVIDPRDTRKHLREALYSLAKDKWFGFESD